MALMIFSHDPMGRNELNFTQVYFRIKGYTIIDAINNT